jgi:ATP-binding cassette subfamily B (MDR/TAP) protein 1
MVTLLNGIGVKFLYYGLIMLVATVTSNMLWFWVAEKQGSAIRRAYFKALLTQEITYYDINSPTSILSTFSSDLDAIQSAIAFKIGVL